MTRSKKLQPVVKHVDNKEQNALQAVAFSQQQLESQLSRLQQLTDYKEEYSNRHTKQTVSYTSVQFQEYNRFLNQLDETIKRQNHVVEMARRELEVKRQKWKLSRSRSDAMHKVLDRIQASEHQQAEKIEQKFMDEVATRNALKNS